VRLLTAINARLGIELAQAHLPDVILMDINLPGMNGYAALNVLRQTASTSRIPVLALSANAVPHDIEKGMAAGFLRYLTKPIRVAEFMAALDIALQCSTQQPEHP
jgi:CheY-like chemotaxis protein